MINELIEFTLTNGNKVAIPLRVITGIVELSTNNYGKCFIATGADYSVEDGCENGFYVSQEYEFVRKKLNYKYAMSTALGGIGDPEVAFKKKYGRGTGSKFYG